MGLSYSHETDITLCSNFSTCMHWHRPRPLPPPSTLSLSLSVSPKTPLIPQEASPRYVQDKSIFQSWHVLTSAAPLHLLLSLGPILAHRHTLSHATLAHTPLLLLTDDKRPRDEESQSVCGAEGRDTRPDVRGAFRRARARRQLLLRCTCCSWSFSSAARRFCQTSLDTKLWS